MDVGLTPRPIRGIPNLSTLNQISPRFYLNSLALTGNNVNIKILLMPPQEGLKPLLLFFVSALRLLYLDPATRLTRFQSCINYTSNLECVTSRGRRGTLALSRTNKVADELLPSNAAIRRGLR